MRRSTRFLPITLLIFAFTLVVFFAHQGAIHAEDDHGDYRFTSTNLVIGSGAISGVIDTSNIMFDVDYFSFSAKRGIKYTFVLDEITVDNANISIINSIALGNENSPDQELTISSREKTVSWIATTTDTYYVEVAGTLNNSDGSFYLGTMHLAASRTPNYLIATLMISPAQPKSRPETSIREQSAPGPTNPASLGH
ncbi:MAG: hypothetical protein Ct9H300mP11_03300 [Chloroflexota bacterium]|nr:MAG: hypothetical protein Ct9H300mP11_03300 [Chloroflexota bacterium]